MNCFTTGMESLDHMLEGLLPGDNLVWNVETIAEYRLFAVRFSRGAREKGKKIVYFRFASHENLLDEEQNVTIIQLDSQKGFESFVSSVVDAIEATHAESWYVFDCLSGLSKDWYADRMMANFFLIVCPYVLRLEALAYFALSKHSHSNHATDTIWATAQVLLEVWTKDGITYVQPQKVEGRRSPTMYMLHEERDGAFIPVTSSARKADVVAAATRTLENFTIQRSGPWTASYREAREVLAELERGEDREEEAAELFERLLNMLITRQTSFLPLARTYFDLPYLSDIQKRLIGSGLIGGKARGILLSQRILRKASDSWDRILEVHDSFFIGSDVFYTFIIQNAVWWLRRKKGTMAEILERAKKAREKILTGTFLDYIELQFRELLEYFGQSPIIVRSSSIQEDSYGNAFSGKYESVFCANQGSPEENLEDFLRAVRTVYASSLSEEALLYRKHHGLLHEDEQMALVVQRVSGDIWGEWFFPPAAGVGFSYNPFVWETSIDPHSGMLRLAFGLGTRAVDRIDDDYTRIVALNEPLKKPDKGTDENAKFIQRKVDLIDLAENRLATRTVSQALSRLPPSVRDLFARLDPEAAEKARELGLDENLALRLDFKGLFEQTDFTKRMRELLAILERAYEHPVDIEFTVNIMDDGNYRINLVQCRPFKVNIRGSGEIGLLPAVLPPEHIFLKSDGPIVGRSLAAPVDRLIYVKPEAYTRLGEQDRYALARLVGLLVHRGNESRELQVMLVGPGRWGTSTAALGVPVTFSDIKGVSILVELALMHEGLVPDVSLGTHFFNDLVEMDMLYFAVFPERPDCLLSQAFLDSADKQLSLIPAEGELWKKAIIVLENSQTAELRLYADATSQRATCYLASRRNL